jgi:GTP pyrophosphokinase
MENVNHKGQSEVLPVKAPLELEPIITRVMNYQPNAPVSEIIRAYRYAERAHAGVKRLSGEPYISHCLAVAEILAGLKMDVATISAGLLHDVIEDTKATFKDIEKEFGSEVAQLVEGVTKIGKRKFDDSEQREVENIRKIIIAMAQDIRVIIIKLADRLHNMRTLQYHDKEKQIRIATDTLEIYAPIAHRLGIGKIKWELEDLCLRYLNPTFYEDVQVMVAKKRREREEYIEQVKKSLNEKLSEAKIKARIEGRPKHFYSIYQKIYNQKKAIEDIYDLTAIRIITDSTRNCYESLGIVHTLWKPILGRFKDYIAMPKSNMYQSLHTTVWGPNNEPLEVQIRTEEMHRISEEGIAAHWLYKEGLTLTKDQYDKRFGWLKQLLEWQSETSDPNEFMRNLKIDLFSDEVFVFTPKGAVKELPVGSTAVDFAYSVHSEVGQHCIGAKVNGKLIPLRSPLNTGDIVEIITNKSANPSRDWLSFVKTSRAKNKISHYLKQIEAEQFIKTGKEELTRELKLLHANFQDVIKSDPFKKICADLGFPGAEELFLAIGSGKASAKNVVNRLYPNTERLNRMETPEEAPFERSQEGILIRGISNVLIRFGKCCHPVPGEPIIGFITRGRGISIHKASCQSIAPFLDDNDRIVQVAWDNSNTGKHLVPLRILGHDRQGLLRDLLDQIAVLGINVSYAKAQQLTGHKAQILVTLEITDSHQLDELIKQIDRIEGVLETNRTSRVR